MPQRRKVDTLNQLCVYVIIKNITKYTTSELHSIPTNILENMIRFPKDADEKFLSIEKSLRISDVDRIRLFRQNITHLTLDFLRLRFKSHFQLTQAQHLGLLDAVLKTSRNLTHFTSKDDTEIWSHRDFLNFTENIPNIVVLKITTTHSVPVNDDILASIGDNCLKLESLILESSSITDDGVQRFCQSKSRGSKIKRLKFSDWSKVTDEGCLIALQSLKQLKFFHCEKVIEVFMKLFQDFNEGQYPIFQLCELPMIPFKRLRTGVLNFITKCCPNLSSLGLDMSGNFEKNVAEFKKFDVMLPQKMFIDKGLSLSQLAVVGSNLTILHIIRANIELDSIGFACPNLKEFKLCSVTYLPLYNSGIRRNQIPFNKLQTLDTSVLLGRSPIPIAHLRFLLKHCLELEKLSLGHHDEINDDDLISVLREINPLRCLTHFSIGFCPGVSKVSIMELLTMENNLQNLAIANSIPVGERHEIESFLKENNYWVIIEYSVFCM